MKKLLGIIVLGLLLSGSAYADHLKVKLKDENQIVLQSKFVNSHEWPMSEAHCAQYKKFNWMVGLTDEHGSKWSLWICSAEKIYSYKGKTLNQHQDADDRYSPNHPWVLATTKKSSTNDKITQSKQICRDLGFKANTEKFADCALKMMSIQFETTNKVASASGGTTQEVIVTHRNDYDIWDALLDVSFAIQANNRSTSSSSSSNSGTSCFAQTTTGGHTIINCD